MTFTNISAFTSLEIPAMLPLFAVLLFYSHCVLLGERVNNFISLIDQNTSGESSYSPANSLYTATEQPGLLW